MAQDYKIQAVAPDTRSYETKFGQMTSYKIKLVDVDKPVELSQKASTPAPQAGQTLHGHIEESQYGPKFKKEQQQAFGVMSSTSSGSWNGQGKSSGFSGKFQSDPFTMYLSYAKDIAVALIATKDGFDSEKFGAILEEVIAGGKTLYNERPGAETKEDKKEDTLPDDASWDVDKAVDFSEIDKIFGKSDSVKTGEEVPFD